MFIPIWTTMAVGLVTFQFVCWQFCRVIGEQSIWSARYILMVVNLAVMLTAIFQNSRGPFVSLGLFGATLLCAGWSFWLYKKMPPRLPSEPSF